MTQDSIKLKIGDNAPDFVLPDRNGTGYQLAEVVKRGPVLLCFFRGTWCADCRTHLKKLEAYYPNYQAVGLQLLSIAHQRADIVAGYFKREPISYPYLLDTDLQVIKRYGLLDPVRFDALLVSRMGLQTTNPAFFLIDPAMCIRWLHISTDKRDLPAPEQMLDVAQRLGLTVLPRPLRERTG